MQVIVDSSFARQGSAPIWGGKKGEFRDWTISALIKTITKFSNVIGYQQPDLSINWTVAHVMLVIGQYASFCARCYDTPC